MLHLVHDFVNRLATHLWDNLIANVDATFACKYLAENSALHNREASLCHRDATGRLSPTSLPSVRLQENRRGLASCSVRRQTAIRPPLPACGSTVSPLMITASTETPTSRTTDFGKFSLSPMALSLHLLPSPTSTPHVCHPCCMCATPAAEPGLLGDGLLQGLLRCRVLDLAHELLLLLFNSPRQQADVRNSDSSLFRPKEQKRTHPRALWNLSRLSGFLPNPKRQARPSRTSPDPPPPGKRANAYAHAKSAMLTPSHGSQQTSLSGLWKRRAHPKHALLNFVPAQVANSSLPWTASWSCWRCIWLRESLLGVGGL